MANKDYLGDSVYVEHDEYGGLILTTENGDDEPSNTIYLDYEVYDALVRYVERIKGDKSDA